jgi:hypothetical protein
MTTFAHHVRLSLAIGLEFQEDNRAESVTFFITDQVLELSDRLAAWLTNLFIWLNFLRFFVPTLGRRFDAWLDSYLAGWAADLALMALAARTITGRDVLGLLKFQFNISI